MCRRWAHSPTHAQATGTAAPASVTQGASDGAVPFGPWKNIFHQALGFDQIRSKAERQATLLGMLNAEMTPMAALVNDVFDIELEGLSRAPF